MAVVRHVRRRGGGGKGVGQGKLGQRIRFRTQRRADLQRELDRVRQVAAKENIQSSACAFDPRQEPSAVVPHAWDLCGGAGNGRPYRDTFLTNHDVVNVPASALSVTIGGEEKAEGDCTACETRNIYRSKNPTKTIAHESRTDIDKRRLLYGYLNLTKITIFYCVPFKEV